MLLDLFNKLQSVVYKTKAMLLDKQNKKFDKRYNIDTLGITQNNDDRYNRYEGTNISLLNKLCQEGYLSRDVVLWDIGCGKGRVLFYCAILGCRKVYGTEYNPEIFAVLSRNEERFIQKTKATCIIETELDKAENIMVYDDVSVVYIFNSFRDINIYRKLFANIKRSLEKSPRVLRIIILVPTIVSVTAIKENSWLRLQAKLSDENQICAKCHYYEIYTTEEKQK